MWLGTTTEGLSSTTWCTLLGQLPFIETSATFHSLTESGPISYGIRVCWTTALNCNKHSQVEMHLLEYGHQVYDTTMMDTAVCT